MNDGRVQPAPISRRVAAFLVHWLVVMAILALLLVFAVPGGTSEPVAYDAWQGPGVDEVMTIGYMVVHLVYLLAMYLLFGGHEGHLVAGIRIADYRTGEPASPRQLIGRGFSTLLDGFMFSFVVNAVLVIVTRRRRHLYDLFCNTMMVLRG